MEFPFQFIDNIVCECGNFEKTQKLFAALESNYDVGFSFIYSLRATWYCTMWHIHYNRTGQENYYSTVFRNGWHLSHKCTFGKFSSSTVLVHKFTHTVWWSYPLAWCSQNFSISKRSSSEENENGKEEKSIWKLPKMDVCFFRRFSFVSMFNGKILFSFTLLNHFRWCCRRVYSGSPIFQFSINLLDSPSKDCYREKHLSQRVFSSNWFVYQCSGMDFTV